MFSIVATETSVLTFISVPGIAYRGNWNFLQLALGYIFGRILVSLILIPLFFKYGVTSIYELLGQRFNKSIQKLASATFLFTRILADGVRFAAVSIIIQSITNWPISLSIIVLGVVTLIYTVSGGLKTVIHIDAFQFIRNLTQIKPGSLVRILIWNNKKELIIDGKKLDISKLEVNVHEIPYVRLRYVLGDILHNTNKNSLLIKSSI